VVAQAEWDDAALLAAVRAQVLPALERQQLLNPPPSGYRIDITWENPSVLQKTKDVTLQANIPHDFGAQ